MPKFTGIRCEECQHTKVEGLAVESGYVDEWREILVANATQGPNDRRACYLNDVAIYLGAANPENSSTLETHYLCSTTCLFNHIAKLLSLHR